MASLGGPEDLPQSLSLDKFVSCRSQEIQQMRHALLAPSGTKLAFQTLPNHMRRRAMSHNVKRLPRRLRQIHLNQMHKSGGTPTHPKRPSRKHRRRPRHLASEYARRARRLRWLPTHLWHARRFHMVERWGHKLPHRPCDKAFRACYRAATNHCLIQDLSYVSCLELGGPRDVIVATMKQLCRARAGLSVAARAFLHGDREGEVTLFDGEDRPVGRVSYQWSPPTADRDKLWLWVHAAFYRTVLDLLIASFGMDAVPNTTTKHYASTKDNITLEELMEELSRFRLTGPLANATLHSALVTTVNDGTEVRTWPRHYIPTHREMVENQCAFWASLSNISSLSEVGPHSVLSLVVQDPRINIPKKRTKSVSVYYEKYDGPRVVQYLSLSPLWEESIRKEVSANPSPGSRIIQLRSELLVPGSDLKDSGTSIPIILVQRPGCKTENIGLGSGWDVILPSVWARPFWIAFTMRGARAGGLRESESLQFEMGQSQVLHPDTSAGEAEERRVSTESMGHFFKKPPNKRVNYAKFNIVTPFRWEWRLLMQDWNGDNRPVDGFTVLRDPKTLTALNLLLTSKTQSVPPCPQNCLIPVRLECTTRGCPAKFALICLPDSARDLTTSVTEPECVDRNEMARKQLRQSHRVLLKRLRRQRRHKPDSFKLAQNHSHVLSEYTRQMRRLWLPEPSTVRTSCSREVIGFVRYGGFSLAHGKSVATGYIVAGALPAVVKARPRDRVLFRNTNTRQYRVAKLTVIVD